MATYDLTGSNPDFKETDQRFMIFEANQVIEFEKPVYADSISVKWIKPDTSVVTVNQGAEWNIRTADRDTAAISDAKLIDENFAGNIVKSIISLTAVPEQRLYVIEYQKLRLDPSEEDFGNDGPEPTPGLLADMIENIDYLLQVKDPLNNVTSETLDTVRVLPRDLAGNNPDNLISDEYHTVNVPSGQSVIRPSAGSFYTHDLEVVNDNTSLTLVKGTDYEIIGLNRPKTRVAENISAVYDFIVLLSPIVGDVRVTYRAFGGEVSEKDINSIKDILADLIRNVGGGQYLTSQSLSTSPTITSILHRIAVLEDDIRHYVTAEHRIISDTAGKHWYSIAELFTDDFSGDVLTAAHVHFGIACQTQGWVYETHLSINLLRTYEKLRVNIASSLLKDTQFSLGQYDNINNSKIPELRIIWVEDVEGNRSGAVIQIGLRMEASVPETVSVYDKSGNGSAIYMYPNVVGTDYVNDDNIPMPDAQTWTESDPEAKVSRQLMCPEEGYLIFGGAQPTHLLVDGAILDTYIDDTNFQPSNIKEMAFYFYDRITGKVIKTTTSHHWDNNEIVTESCIFYADDLCALHYNISGGNGAPVTFEVKALLGSHSIINERFDLLQIVAHF